ncbi:MAG: sugar phosphate isomerase/epimerase family protein [Candidatus Hydrogenedentota bacterium]
MSNIGIALQLFSVRQPGAADLPAALSRCREAGFDFVQWNAMPDLPAPEIRRLLDTAGLKAIAGHASIEAFEQDIDAAVTFWETVGAPDIATGARMTECCDTRDAWIAGAQRLETLGARLRAYGMRLSYHNQAFELEPFPGEHLTKLDLLYANTNPENLYAELDTGWLAAAGADPATTIRAYAGRCPILHVKDLAAERDNAGNPIFTALGAGVLDWDDIFDAAEEAAAEWYVYEQDTRPGAPFDAVCQSYAFLAERA